MVKLNTIFAVAVLAASVSAAPNVACSASSDFQTCLQTAHTNFNACKNERLKGNNSCSLCDSQKAIDTCFASCKPDGAYLAEYNAQNGRVSAFCSSNFSVAGKGKAADASSASADASASPDASGNVDPTVSTAPLSASAIDAAVSASSDASSAAASMKPSSSTTSGAVTIRSAAGLIAAGILGAIIVF